MRVFGYLLRGALALATCASAHATMITYDLTGVTTSAGTLTGTVVLNSTTDLLTSANISFLDASAGDPVFNIVGTEAAYNGLSQDYIAGLSTSWLNFGGQVALFFDTANVGRGALQICVAGSICGTQGVEISQVAVYSITGNGGPFAITAGSLVPHSVMALTPEPPSSVLLGTAALLFVAGGSGSKLRRHFARLRAEERD